MHILIQSAVKHARCHECTLACYAFSFLYLKTDGESWLQFLVTFVAHVHTTKEFSMRKRTLYLLFML